MAAKDTEEKKSDEQDVDLALDMSQTAVKKMIAEARDRGYITYDQLNNVLPPDQVSSEQIEDVMSMLSEMGINIIEDDEAEDEDNRNTDLVTTAGTKDVALSSGDSEKLDRTDDPVRMYLREMGSVELLSREGEIAIAKRIEAGRNTMISGLCESPLTFQAITIWRDELLNEDILLRDVIDLEATFGNQLGEDDEPVIDTANVTAEKAAVKNDEPELDADGNPIIHDDEDDEDDEQSNMSLASPHLSGELGYELAIPSRFGSSLFNVLKFEAEQRGGGVYGMEAMNVLRMEKGFITHAEIDGRATAYDVGMQKMISEKKDFIGNKMAQRPGLLDPNRERLVGLKTNGAHSSVTAGSHLFNIDDEPLADNNQGYISSAAFSPIENCYIGLAFLKRGPERWGEKWRFQGGTSFWICLCPLNSN